MKRRRRKGEGDEIGKWKGKKIEESRLRGGWRKRKMSSCTPLPWEAIVLIFGVIIKLKAFFRLHTHPLKLERVTIPLAQFYKNPSCHDLTIKKGIRVKNNLPRDGYH